MSERKSCPMKFPNPNRADWGVECDESACMWYDKRSGQCKVAYEGYLASFKQSLKESRE